MAKRQPFNEYMIYNDGTCEFYITNKKQEKFIVKVDRDDLERLIKFNRRWNASWRKDSNSYYVVCCEYLEIKNGKPKYKTHYLHRWIFQYPKNILIDHRNHDTLDNRKENLRQTNIPNNSKHRETKNKNNTSGYRNVSWIDKIGCYVVQLQVNGKNKMLGEFNDVDEAGKFAEQMREKYYKEYKGDS